MNELLSWPLYCVKWKENHCKICYWELKGFSKMDAGYIIYYWMRSTVAFIT